jgi:putative transposase
MPRRARLELPCIPLHITHRGVNRCAVFIDDEDRHHYLRLLGLFAGRNGLAVHAYVLMSNHVHLLTSSSAPGAASEALRRATQCYVQMFNQRHRRTGTLWEGRFKSCLVATDRHALSVYRYIERNPADPRPIATSEGWTISRANHSVETSPCRRKIGSCGAWAATCSGNQCRRKNVQAKPRKSPSP